MRGHMQVRRGVLEFLQIETSETSRWLRGLTVGVWLGVLQIASGILRRVLYCRIMAVRAVLSLKGKLQQRSADHQIRLWLEGEGKVLNTNAFTASHHHCQPGLSMAVMSKDAEKCRRILYSDYLLFDIRYT